MHPGESEPLGDGAGETPADPAEQVTLAITSGLQAGAKLRENRVFHLTPLGAEFQGSLTREQAREGFHFLRMMDDAGHLWLADFINKTARDHGQEFVQETLVGLQFPLDQAQRAIAIGSLHRGVRHPALTTEHYWVLAHSEKKLSESDQLKWAKIAVENKMTAAHLAKCISAGKVLQKEDAGRLNGRGSGLATPHGIRQAFDTWLRTVDDHDPIHQWSVERKRELYEELKPVAKVVADLEESLAQDNEREPLSEEDEALVEKCIYTVRQEGKATTSLLQRRHRLGYLHAVRLMEELERRGIVSAPDSGGQRTLIAEGSEVGA